MKLLTWMKQHPVQFCAVTVGLLGIALLAIPNWPDEFTCCVMPWIGLACMGLVAVPLVCRKWKRRVSVLLVLCFLTPDGVLNADEPEPPPVQEGCFWCYVLAAGAALAGGVVLIIKAKRSCERIKKKKQDQDKKNNPDDDQAQAYRGCKKGTCAYLADTIEIPERLHYEFQIDRGVIKPETFHIIPQSDLMPWREWKEELNAAGMPVEGDGSQQTYIVGNRISFDGEWIVIDNGGVPLYLEQSSDLEHWWPLMSINAPENTRITFEDSSDGKALFYRVVNGGVE